MNAHTQSQLDALNACVAAGEHCGTASLHDQNVAVNVENGRATLSGTVDTWLDRKHAARAAHEAGAREVNNHLRVTAAALRVGRKLLTSHEIPSKPERQRPAPLRLRGG